MDLTGTALPRRRHASRTFEQIHGELAVFLAGRERFPGRREFSLAGKGSLYAALSKHGGPGAWAERFGLPSARRQPWPERRIALELDAFMAGRTEWPAQREFKAAGKWRLLQAIYASEGTHAWAARYGMTPRPAGRERAWTEERIGLELRRLITRHGRIPPRGAMEAQAPGLYEAMRRNGGPARWRRRFAGSEQDPARRA